jgi:hypothetical protein
MRYRCCWLSQVFEKNLLPPDHQRCGAATLIRTSQKSERDTRKRRGREKERERDRARAKAHTRPPTMCFMKIFLEVSWIWNIADLAKFFFKKKKKLLPPDHQRWGAAIIDQDLAKRERERDEREERGKRKKRERDKARANAHTRPPTICALLFDD